MTRKRVRIYTDGACEGNPGPGGIGVVLLSDGSTEKYSQGYRLTTNNRMELMAAIAGLERTPEGSQVTVYSDSKYLVDAITKGWAEGWRARGYVRKGNRRVPNADLWERLLALIEKGKVDFEWVKGHAGDRYNEEADRLSYAAIGAPDALEDEGYRQALALEESAPTRITQEGQPCRKCGTPVVRKAPKGKRKPGQSFYYAYYLYCPSCEARYYVEAARREIEQGNLF